MKKIAILSFLALAACSDSDGARLALEREGYTDIEVLGHAFVGCPETYIFRTMFRATNPSGERVRGAVCSDLFDPTLIVERDERLPQPPA